MLTQERKDKAIIFNKEDGTKYIKRAKITKEISFYNTISINKSIKVVNKAGTVVRYAKECEERKDEGRRRLYSFIFPGGDTFPLYDSEFTWIEDEIIK